MADPHFARAWENELAYQAEGLDLNDPKERELFRHRVEKTTTYLAMWGHRSLADHLGVKPAHSKEATARRIADAWIERNTP